jgi:hypothetical protein
VVPDNDKDVIADGHVNTATWRLMNHVLFVILLSPELKTYHVNLKTIHCTHVVGVTGIYAASTARGTSVIVFVHVTVLPVNNMAPQFQPLDVNHVVGPLTHVATTNVAIWRPVDPVFPAFVVVIGISDVTPTAIVGTGCPIPGMLSGTFVAT